MPSPLIRSALMVRNLDRSRRFYEDVLGLTRALLEADLTDTIAWKLLGVSANSSVRCAILKPDGIGGRPAPSFGMIGLFELSDSKIGELPQRKDGVVYGESILVFYVENLANSLALTIARGGTILNGPEEFKLPHVQAMEAIVRDPDGIAINLVEAPESAAWK